jgi:hypothetical protein
MSTKNILSQAQIDELTDKSTLPKGDFCALLAHVKAVGENSADDGDPLDAILSALDSLMIEFSPKKAGRGKSAVNSTLIQECVDTVLANIKPGATWSLFCARVGNIYGMTEYATERDDFLTPTKIDNLRKAGLIQTGRFEPNTRVLKEVKTAIQEGVTVKANA